MARVLLGLYDQHVLPGHQTSYDVNKIGGHPDWMVRKSQDPRCSLCGLPTLFIGQFYCPLSGSEYHRTLYIFTCNRPTCCQRPESWTVLRSQLIAYTSASVSTNESQISIADEWGSEADNWNDEETSCLQADVLAVTCSELPAAVSTVTCSEPGSAMCTADIELKLQEVSITYNAVEFEVHDSLTPSQVLHSYYLYVIEEPSTEGSLEHEQQLLKRYAEQEGVDLSSLHMVESCGESYTASQVRCGEKVADRTFYKFTKRLNRCPQQLIRYSHRGEPLYARSGGKHSIPRCECGSPRVFELQLMPGLVNYLLRSGDDSTDPVVEYLSVYIFTCERSCWSNGNDTVRSEFVLVDNEDDVSAEALSVIAKLDCTKLAADSMQASSVDTE